ncbi:MAG: NAD(P)/FAD-dependent oxidoreductase [Candidatus Omnitrophica bacterium]|nr:NAD(P)/FAD-dependent oxidoreductase [Candidatus Omnitrophota bacterium]
MRKLPIIIVGAGPAGMMAAICAAQFYHPVILLEKNSSCGCKLLLTGKGRCNLTNLCSLEEFLSRFFSNGQFLRDAFKEFFNTDLMEFFRERGVELVVERQQRVFPASGKAKTILETLQRELRGRNVQVICNCSVKDIVTEENHIRAVKLKDGRRLSACCVVIATGGVSYPDTGSTGDGIRWARQTGHSIVPLRPGLVGLWVGTDEVLPEGLTLKNIRLTFFNQNKKIITDIGEMLFTAQGISGPLVLTYSGLIADWLLEKKEVWVSIDFKPALSFEQLHNRLLREFQNAPAKRWKNILKELLPISMIDVFVKRLGFSPNTTANQITARQRQQIVQLLKDFRLRICSTALLKEAMITRGGVSVKDIDPRTMQSRLIQGLYFCGEVIDVDADTGGFNLQAAFSTGWLAGKSAALLAKTKTLS